MSTGNMLPHDWFPRPLPPNVTIGARSWCHSSFAFLHYQSLKAGGVQIGDDTGIYRGSFFDLGPEAEVQIGNYCTLVGAIISTNGKIVVGDYTFIAHEVVLADEAAATPSRHDEGHVENPSIVIEEDCWIGARAILLRGAHIGAGAIVGAGAVVDFKVPASAIVAGNPACIVGWTTAAAAPDSRDAAEASTKQSRI